MNKTILICLVAVVVAIVIIALAALRFLRADDTDPFDEMPDEPRRPGRAPEDARGRDAVPAGTAATRSAGRAAPERAARNSGHSEPGFGEPGYSERPGQDRPPAPERRGGQGGTQSRPVPAPVMSSAPRAAKAGRAGKGGDGPDWDTMSDVDYWAELSADKHFNGADAPVPPASGRRGANQVAGGRGSGRGEMASPARAGRPEAAGPRGTGRGEPGEPLPTRSRQPRPAAAGPGPAHAPGRYAAEPATQSIAALARLANQVPAPAQSPVPHPPVSQPNGVQRPMPPSPISQPHRTQPPISQPHQQVRPLPAPLDDDPLTSPSFPAINTSDSRSYRTSRPSDGRPSHPRTNAIMAGPRGAAASYGEPTQEFTTYPQGPTRATDAQRNSAPGGYPVQPPAPAGNPYGSFVSQPPTRQEPGYAGYGSPQASGSENWYSPSGEYLPAAPVPNGGAANGGAANGGYANGAGANGYDQPVYQGIQPDAAYQQPTYPAVQYDQAGYGGQDAAYGRDAYQGYPGYGAGGY
jgi:hypothetical protein